METHPTTAGVYHGRLGGGYHGRLGGHRGCFRESLRRAGWLLVWWSERSRLYKPQGSTTLAAWCPQGGKLSKERMALSSIFWSLFHKTQAFALVNTLQANTGGGFCDSCYVWAQPWDNRRKLQQGEMTWEGHFRAWPCKVNHP